MDKSFTRLHGAMLLRYGGISFISGAINHGFFSTERSAWTAAVGIVLFALAVWMEHRGPAAGEGLGRTLAWGALLSVGLGFFTGGLQHFPDSPARSAWVVPLGFVMSVFALALLENFRFDRAIAAYAIALGVLVTGGSYAAWQWLEAHPAAGHDGHDGHDHDHGAEAKPAPAGVTRTVEMGMDDQMRFTPSTVRVQAGDTVRFLVRNTGKVEHELVIGTDAEIKAHAEEMRAHAGHAHAHAGNAVSVAPGGTGELVVSFPTAGQMQMACLVPGHYEAGMRGVLDVVPR